MAREAAEGLVAAVIDLYGEGLARILEALDEAGPPAAEVRGRIVEDGVVASLLLIHGLHPVDLETRVQEALDSVRPYMQSHGGDVELLGARRRRGAPAPGGLLPGLPGVVGDARAGDPAGARGGRARPAGPRGGGDPGAPRTRRPVTGGPGQRAELVGALRRLRTAGAPAARDPARAPDERCELCRTTIPDEHRHLLHLVERRIVCVCSACWSMRSGDAEFRPVGARTLWLDDMVIADDVWARFAIPIGLAFFMRSTQADGVVALYPSPAGATESELDLQAWDELVALNPVLGEMEADAEGLIVNRTDRRRTCTSSRRSTAATRSSAR